MLIQFPEEIREKVESTDNRTTTEQPTEQLAKLRCLLDIRTFFLFFRFTCINSNEHGYEREGKETREYGCEKASDTRR